MHFRWTIKDLKEKSDLEILRGIVTERISSCTNPYSPLSERLNALYAKLDKKIQSGKRNL